MATAKKLPSGMYRCLSFDYTDIDGKRHYKSFTAQTKKEAELLAAQYKNHSDDRREKIQDISLPAAIDQYIELKKNVLSPSTLRGYRQYKSYYASIGDRKIKDLKGKVIDNWIKNFSGTHSPKTVSNAYGFLSVVLKENGVDIGSHKLPQKMPPEYYIPSDQEVQDIIAWCHEHDTELEKAVYLAAWCMMRRSEICGLCGEDIDDTRIHIHNTMVKGSDYDYMVKNSTKNSSSNRYIDIPPSLAKMLPKQGKVVNITPDALTRRFERYFEITGTHKFRFHDLRAYSASVRHAQGVPDQYIMSYGGWSSDKILKQVYRRNMEQYEQKYTAQMNDFFETYATQNAT
ncbi:MAG: site-specific integrase [Roseburia sp.]|nr:site-specific integrase [Roseburia sp.]MCM1430250.1 site-specific integrase [Muribaculaceae bacterium]